MTNLLLILYFSVLFFCQKYIASLPSYLLTYWLNFLKNCNFTLLHLMTLPHFTLGQKMKFMTENLSRSKFFLCKG